jgi:hypothetical protein
MCAGSMSRVAPNAKTEATRLATGMSCSSTVSASFLAVTGRTYMKMAHVATCGSGGAWPFLLGGVICLVDSVTRPQQLCCRFDRYWAELKQAL